MKLKNILSIIALGSLILQACDDNKMKWFNPHEGNGITSSELPLELAEKISRYDAIKSYIPRTDFQIGVGMGMDLYMDDEAYRNIVNANFNSITLGNAMKQSSILNNKGEADYSKVDALLQVLPQDINVYGHNLIWHTQQAATYLNNLIAPTIIIHPDDTDKMNNIISNSDFEAANITGWSAWSSADCKAEISAKGEGYNSDYSMKLTNPEAGDNYSAQAFYKLPANAIIAGKTYVCTFYAKSMEGDDNFQIQLQKRADSYPGSNYISQKLPAGQWYSFEAEFTATDTDETMDHIVIDFGATAGIYYIDDFKFGTKKEDPDAGRSNLLANGNFKEGIDNWSKWNGPDECNTWNQTEGNKDKGCLQVINPDDNDGGEWQVQIHAELAQNIPSGTNVYISYYAKMTEGTGSIRMSTTGKSYYEGNQTVTPEWKRIEWTITTEGEEEVEGVNFDLGLRAGTYLIDDVMVSLDPFNTTTRGISTRSIEYIEKTDEEKETLISGAMEKWIKEMVGHYKDRVHAWDVLNEPIDDNGKLRGVDVVPSADDMDTDDFYYGKYMGKIYGAKAFIWAHEADPTAKLFINDYNLEYNPDKCDKLIDYVKYIEENGGQVDGIGTQMHIAIDSDKEKIAAMFDKLATTGKLIKITELDIKVNTASPTTENLASQAEMYQYVIDAYKQHIPESQQYGITIWGVSDNEKEHEHWIPDDAPDLFDANYARKHAYKGVCDGLAGKDVSEDFPGDLQK
ncbi:MAG: endo-1,4-beta-xylanase [Bacteroides sp.]|jgi:GH35 family endo-1,4-beta-xylanase|nr:endo-1,4-beta-xylanase [Bacteroides sp.]MCI1683184.1 endo-1,4-beta-xylanase [Bacteroides sp.]